MSAAQRVGELRRSQLLHSYGIGATVELPGLAVLVMGLDTWQPDACGVIAEPRLLDAVRRELGDQVQRLASPPVPKDDGLLAPLQDGAEVGVPVAALPRWLRCPSCNYLGPIWSGVFKLKFDRFRPDRTCYLHAACGKVSKPPPVLPARFLSACERGHLDDFPWAHFVHQGPTSCKAELELREVGVSGEPRDLELRCRSCEKKRRLVDAFGPEGSEQLPRCKGRRPHLRDYEEEGCGEPLRAILLGALNSWFPISLTVLAVPAERDELPKLVEANWGRLEAVTDPVILAFLRTQGQLGALATYADQEIWQAIEQRREHAAIADQSTDLKRPEWERFAHPEPDRNGPDFRLRMVEPPPRYQDWFDSVVLVERLREVGALVGFTRIDSPRELGYDEEALALRRVPLSRKPPAFVPASEVRGEGIFLRFREDRVARWCEANAAREEAFRVAHRGWRRRLGLHPDKGFPGLRFILLHSFAHALMRQLALECGYTAASIRERIYACDPGDEPPMAGVLIYTAAPDSEGTLGGLVSLGQPDRLQHHIDQAFELMRLCASDPLCAEHEPAGEQQVDLHGAACHACLFAPETSCERGNQFLDRSLLVETLASSGTPIAFFQQVDGPSDLPGKDAPGERGVPVYLLSELARYKQAQPIGWRAIDGVIGGKHFLARMVGRGMDRSIPAGAWVLFERLDVTDPPPPKESVVLVMSAELDDPDLGPLTVRKMLCTRQADADGDAERIVVSLRPSCSDSSYHGQNLAVPATEWEGWRPYARVVKVYG